MVQSIFTAKSFGTSAGTKFHAKRDGTILGFVRGRWFLLKARKEKQANPA
jgi:hypothetical protein